MAEPVGYGGQAVLEGVMMRGARTMALAMRHPEGHVVVKTEEIDSRFYTGPVARVPLLRGALRLFDSLRLGLKALNASADVALGDEAEFSGAVTTLSMVAGLGIGIGLFILLPSFLVGLVFPNLEPAFLISLLEGIVRLLLIIAYVCAVSLLPDIRRVYAYHGAEHKTINALEAGADLTVEAVQEFSTAHRRCGTAFLLTVAMLAILFYAPFGNLPLGWRLASRLVMLPVVAGLSYELIRLSSRYSHLGLVRALSAPNLALQALTTREPDASMVEVAIAALKALLSAEEGAAAPVDAAP